MKNITHGTWIAIADGAKALVLRNEGEADIPNFVVLDIFKNPDGGRTSDIGTERPGRVHQSGTAGRAGVSQTDWHDIGEHRFAKDFAETLGRHCEAGDFKHLVVVAPPRALADLRKAYSKKLATAIVAEIDKDLTKHPLYEIERLLLAS
jgi:protein required for attachment to host cells